MGVIISRLVLQLALGAAFGAGQLVFATVASHTSLIGAGTGVRPSAAAIITAPAAPAGIGWG